MTTTRAHLTNTFMGEWELFVPTKAPVQDWPLHEFGRTSPVPTQTERAAALAALGYESAEDGEWEWKERDNDFTGCVEFTASLTVRTATGGGAR
ncbi:DUF6303 family protein [Streptomyces sp. NPDC058734]|uniref:DUF6303 family protein n=1 Tax=Streptomyces sp. NPDC058734 TaxID=3346615 RepID=UPI0036A769C8